MVTSVMTLREFADQVRTLADEWDGEQPAVLIGDLNGSINVSDKDGFSNYGPVGYAQECFDGNGVLELGQHTDNRFFGTKLISQDHLADDAREQLQLTDFGSGGSD